MCACFCVCVCVCVHECLRACVYAELKLDCTMALSTHARTPWSLLQHVCVWTKPLLQPGPGKPGWPIDTPLSRSQYRPQTFVPNQKKLQLHHLASLKGEGELCILLSGQDELETHELQKFYRTLVKKKIQVMK